ncbi:hypothetical protein N7528_010201 [Penicillium herquei]|nr:hypothetical protein N7528_010201 [Penicillium herquei]
MTRIDFDFPGKGFPLPADPGKALRPREYFSTSPYYFHDEQAEAIVRTSAYYHKDPALAVIYFPPREHVAVCLSLANPFQRSTSTGLGLLDRLPPELLSNILYTLDMRSLLTFRQVNLRSREMVHYLTQYNKIAVHGLNLLCGLLRTRLAVHISLLEFYNALCTKNCAFCGEFGGFMCLPIWKRCCFKCVEVAPQTQIKPFYDIQDQFFIPESESESEFQRKQLRVFTPLSGIYTMNETIYEARRWPKLVSLYWLGLVCERKPILQVAPSESQPLFRESPELYNCMAACALPYYDKSTGEVDHGLQCAGCLVACRKSIITTSRMKLEYGLSLDKTFTKAEFLDHFRWCACAQYLWETSDEGKKEPDDLPYFAIAGGIFCRKRDWC